MKMRLLLGSTSMGSGLWLRFSESTKEFFNGGMLMSGSASVAVPIVLGILMFIAVILSCSEKKCFVQMFCVLVVILVVAEITVGVLVYVYKQEIGDSIVNVYKSILDKSTNDEVAGVTLTLIHNTSCPKRIKELINSKAPLVMGVFIGTGVLLIAALVCFMVCRRRLLQNVSTAKEEDSGFNLCAFLPHQ
ncbi:hypothetical protein INR49_028573 [Caranx melampygus]|nr:hypothetical protein INR49_028573 [Caranx melampygus]